MSEDSTPFAVHVKEWTAAFVDDLVTVLSQSMSGGVPDASLLICYFIQQVVISEID